MTFRREKAKVRRPLWVGEGSAMDSMGRRGECYGLNGYEVGGQWVLNGYERGGNGDSMGAMDSMGMRGERRIQHIMLFIYILIIHTII